MRVKTDSFKVQKKLKDVAESTSSSELQVKKLEHLKIGLNDILLATNNFSKSEEFWFDDYGKCYRAQLECIDREYLSCEKGKSKGDLPKKRYTVNVKRIHNEDVFHREIEILGNCKHDNIGSLFGFCDEDGEMILVLEYFSWNLYSALSLPSFTWKIRLKICLDIAHGLNYLHNEMENQKMVIHRDLNGNNIEIVPNYESAKIFGFGLSVFLPPNQDDDALHLNEIPSTNNYMDPEYARTGRLKKQSDVYSFGVVMFELLHGKSAYSLKKQDGDCKESEISHLAKRWFQERVIKQNVASIIKEDNSENTLFINKGPNEDSLDTFIQIVYQCLAETQNQRPTMQIVVNELEKALKFQENHTDTFRMSFEDIKLATQSFSHVNVIGGGGFGRVYKGELAHEQGNGYGNYTIVAKRLDTRLGQGETQFYNELQILSKYKHENVVGLVGYCNDTQERIIVYEHASNGSLDNYLNDASLTWIKRLNICIDVASGLAFLHEGVQGNEVVIHRDMKTANILLFDDWKAKVADFGLSLISTISDKTDYVIDHVCGTRGYLDPLYAKSGFLTIESDIYSFGVVLFEILCGKSTYEYKKHENHFLDSLVKQHFKEGRLDEVVFNAIKEQIRPESLATFQAIAYRCLHDHRKRRPTAQHVLVELQKALELQVQCKESWKWQGILDLCCCFRD